jgi:hypothetical protein
MPFCVRKYKQSKWPIELPFTCNQIKSDSIFYDLETSDNELSIWQIDIDSKEELDKIAITLASSRDNLDTFEMVWMPLDMILGKNLKLNSKLGDSPISVYNSMHRNVAEMSLISLVSFAELMLNAIENGRYTIYRKKELKALLRARLDCGDIKVSDLKPNLQHAMGIT